MALTERYVSDAGAGDGSGSSEANAMSFATFTDYMSAGGSFTAAAGDRFNIKGSITSRTTTSDTWVNGGTVTSPVIIRGYASAITDGYQGRTNGNGALVTTNMAVLPYTTGLLTISGNFILVESMKFTGARNGASILTSGTDVYLYACAHSNAAAGASGMCLDMQGLRNSVINCDLTLTNGTNAGVRALYVEGTGQRAIGNRITSTAVGMNVAASATVVLNNTVYTCTGIGISSNITGNYGIISGNTVVGGASDGIAVLAGTTGSIIISNNCCTDNGGYGINLNNANVGCVLFNNRTRDNTSGAINLGTDWVSATNYLPVTTDGGGAETDYISAGSPNFDYRLKTTATASPAVNAGAPPYRSIGSTEPIQSAAASSGGSYTFIG